MDSEGNAAMKVLEGLAQGSKPSDWQLAAALESLRRLRVRRTKLEVALAETLDKYAVRVPKRITNLVASTKEDAAA